MKALIYSRASNKELKDILIEECKKFCLEEGLEIKSTYFDIGARPSSPKSRWKGFLGLLQNLQESDCIVCRHISDLPPFFVDPVPSTLIRFPSDAETLKEINKFSMTMNEFIRFYVQNRRNIWL